MSRSTPPGPDQSELSVFGPGRGECIVLHVGDNQWAVVDSCVGAGRRESVALEYLRAIDVLPERIRLVLATHWHDDHMRGLADLLRLATNARFGCSVAFQTREFARLIATADPAFRRSGVDEFASIVGLLSERRESNSAGDLGEIAWAFAGRQLLSLSANGRSFPAAIHSFSPSDATVRSALEEISASLPRQGEPRRVISHRTPNDTSVVLWVSAGSTRLLLGGDLEHRNRPGEGWLAVLTQHDGVSAMAFKVPHHGSASADCADVWSTMLVSAPIAILTPYSSGVTPLPSPADLRRLTGRTSHLYCTAQPNGTGPARREAFIEKQLKRVTRTRRVVVGESCQVRVRWRPQNPSAPPEIEMFSGAYRIGAAPAA